MNKRTITKILTKVHEKFVASITDPPVRDAVQRETIITGGCITSMLLNDEVSDFDYYFTTQTAALAASTYFVQKFKEEHPEVRRDVTAEVVEGRVTVSVGTSSGAGSAMYFETDPTDSDERSPGEPLPSKIEKGKFSPVYLTSNAITLTDKIQLIIRFQGTPEEIHENFDFVHCTNYWDAATGRLHLNQEALECTLAKQLIYRGSLFPVCSVIRTRKFIRRGWHINAGQYLKMCFQISEIDLTNLDTLREQLVGVDSTYFAQLIDYCQAAQAKNKGLKVTTPYLATIIDKIFS